MKPKYLRDQRGVAMLLELVLVAAVLGLVGVAVYQSNHRPGGTASVSGKPAPPTAAGIADSAAKLAEESADTDASISNTAEASAAEVSDTDVDAANLGGSTSEGSY